ncbi:hypothetical protein [Pectobacterium brasiliense]|uniref:hypothetical protein n=1 Tax=Pectobacterium brasiliense TaxID=180957 RepID=UPI001F081F9E|nr:hypothetical protein [Pectobacterium brasiliense]
MSNRHDNFVSGGYDAGIMIGSYIEQDMIAVRLSPPFKWAVFAFGALKREIFIGGSLSKIKKL